MKFSFNSNNKDTLSFFTMLVDKLIPHDPRMDKASKVINIKKFLRRILKNQNLRNKIRNFDIKSNKEITNSSDLAKYFVEKKFLDDEIGNDLIIEYFSSKKIFNRLNKKNKKYNKIDIYKLIKKNEKIRK